MLSLSLCSEHVGFPADHNTRDPGIAGVAKRRETASGMGRSGEESYDIQKIEFTMSEAVPGEVLGDTVQLSLHTHGHRRLS